SDEFTKEGLAIDVDGRIRFARVIDMLSRLVSTRGAPRFLRRDNGPEFVFKALLSWIVAQGIPRRVSEPRMFRSHAEAKGIIEAWRRHYNEVRPHSSLDYLTPFVAQATRPSPMTYRIFRTNR